MLGVWLGLPRSDALSDPILTPPLFLPSCEEVLPVGIIAGATIGAGILLIFFFIALVFFLYRRRKGSKYGSSAGHSPRSIPCPAASNRQCLGGVRGLGTVLPRPGGSRSKGWQEIFRLSPCPRSQGCDLEEAGHQGGDSEPGAAHHAF